MKRFSSLKRFLSGILIAVIIANTVPTAGANAEEQAEVYPYTIFAASADDAAITIRAENFTLNGIIATNGTLVSTGTVHINGKSIEKQGESMRYIFNQIDKLCFNSNNVEEYLTDYTLEKLNIDILTPTKIQGELNFMGNMNVSTAIRSLGNMNLEGDVINADKAVICSKYGDINIVSGSVNLNGLIYAPFGCVNVKAQNLNLNNAVVIADRVVFDCPNINANDSVDTRLFVGSNTEKLDIPFDEWRYMGDNNENCCPDFFEDPANWTYLFDTDRDGLPDPLEIALESNIHMIDSDSDGLDDYYEVIVLLTNPVSSDTDLNGIQDYDEDFDRDGLSNGEEYLIGTEPEIKDTDRDKLVDGDEINIYDTNPLLVDSDADDISDGDELVLNTDPNEVSENTRDSFTKTFKASDFGYADDELIPDVEFTADATGIMTFNMEYRYSDLVFNPMTPGYLAGGVNLSSEGEFGEATLKYYIPDEMLDSKDFEPAIYYFDEENMCLKELDDTTRKGNVLSASLEHFSTYAIMNKKAFDKKFSDKRNLLRYLPLSDDRYNTRKADTDVVFVIDDSGSMDYNDENNERKKSTSDFISSMPATDCLGIVSFTASEPRTLLPLTVANESGKEKAKAALDNLENSWTGTDGSKGLREGIDMLVQSHDDNAKCVIFITDGSDTNCSYNYDSLIKTAQNNGITIFTIGLKNYVNGTLLRKIATQTDGRFFEIHDFNQLNDCYEKIRDLTIDYITDTNDDGISDYYTWKICSGQMTDGFGNEILPFGNPYDISESGIEYNTLKNNVQIFEAFKRNAEYLYNRVQESDDFDNDGIKNGQEIKIANNNEKCYVRTFSSPDCRDTDSDGISDYDEYYKYKTSRNQFTAVCTFEQYNRLTYHDYYIASIYKNQYLSGNIMNQVGMAVSKLYARNPRHDIYVKEVSNALAKLYASYTDREYRDSLTYSTLNSAKNYMNYVRTVYAANFNENLDKILTNNFRISEFYEAQRTFIDTKKAESKLEYCANLDQIHTWAKEFLQTTDLSKFETNYNLKTAALKDTRRGLKEAFDGKGARVLRAFDVCMILIGGAMEGLSTAEDYQNLQICTEFFSDSEEILTRIQGGTCNSCLSSVLEEIIPAIHDSKKSAQQQWLQILDSGAGELGFESLHTLVSWCGNVGAVIETAVALGTLTGIPETAQYAYQTCCSASMADCFAAEWEKDINERMEINSNGIHYSNENSGYADPQVIINYQRYVIVLRRESNECFIAMEESGAIPSLKQWINKNNISDAMQVRKELRFDFLKKLHCFIDARIYAFGQ